MPPTRSQFSSPSPSSSPSGASGDAPKENDAPEAPTPRRSTPSLREVEAPHLARLLDSYLHLGCEGCAPVPSILPVELDAGSIAFLRGVGASHYHLVQDGEIVPCPAGCKICLPSPPSGLLVPFDGPGSLGWWVDVQEYERPRIHAAHRQRLLELHAADAEQEIDYAASGALGEDRYPWLYFGHIDEFENLFSRL